MKNHVGFLLPRNSFFYEGFNRKVVQLVEAGLMQRYVAQYAEDYKEPEDDGEAVPLTLEHLGIGFEICFLFIAVAFVLFLCEFMCVRLARYQNIFYSLSTQIMNDEETLKISNILILLII